MFKPRIKIVLEIYPGDSREVWRELGDCLISESFRSIDRPSTNADPFTVALLCTEPAEIKRTMKTRKEIAALIADEITNALLDEMGARDTEMGYKISSSSSG